MERTVTEATTIYISMDLDCPECGDAIDLMRIEEGEIHTKALGVEFGGDNLEIDYECPHCGTRLRTNTVIW